MSMERVRGSTHPQPCGVTTPKKQSPELFSTTWSRSIGVMTIPALVSGIAAKRAIMTGRSFIFVGLAKLCEGIAGIPSS